MKNKTIEKLHETLRTASKDATRIVSTLPAQAPAVRPTIEFEKFPDNEELRKRKEELELSQLDRRFEAEMEQRKIDRDLKKSIASVVFRFLATETGALFVIVLLQGLNALTHFHLEDSTINIFLAATLLQISSMAIIITRHLYPTSGTT